MKIAYLGLALLLASCGTKVSKTPVIPLPPENVVVDTKLVPVLCSEVVDFVKPDIDGATTAQQLEEKAYRLTRSDAQHRIYITRLEEAAMRCGVTIRGRERK